VQRDGAVARRGRVYVDAELKRNLIAERPGRARDINAVFEALGL